MILKNEFFCASLPESLSVNRFHLPCFPKRTQRYIQPFHSTKRLGKVFEKFFR